ncbi:replication factor A2 [Nematocida sp. AWRm77]|nr:replication factor A2 [Nematocida sp. AWRm77]
MHNLKRLDIVLPLRRLSAKQALGAEKGENGSTLIYIDGVELSNNAIVILVGWISGKTDITNRKDFYVEDGTGKIKCIMWEGKKYTYMIDHFENGTFVKLLGTIGINDNYPPSFYCTSVSRVEDGNYLAYHFLQAMYQHAEILKGARQMSQEFPPDNTINGLDMDCEKYIQESIMAEKDLTSVEKDIIKFIECHPPKETGHSDIGIETAMVVLGLRSSKKYTAEEIEKGIDSLINVHNILYRTSENQIVLVSENSLG